MFSFDKVKVEFEVEGCFLFAEDVTIILDFELIGVDDDNLKGVLSVFVDGISTDILIFLDVDFAVDEDKDEDDTGLFLLTGVAKGIPVQSSDRLVVISLTAS